MEFCVHRVPWRKSTWPGSQVFYTSSSSWRPDRLSSEVWSSPDSQHLGMNLPQTSQSQTAPIRRADPHGRSLPTAGSESQSRIPEPSVIPWDAHTMPSVNTFPHVPQQSTSTASPAAGAVSSSNWWSQKLGRQSCLVLCWYSHTIPSSGQARVLCTAASLYTDTVLQGPPQNFSPQLPDGR